MPLAAAVVGTGFIGPVHVEALRRIGIPVVGILGSNFERSRAAAATLGIERGYRSIDELLADERVQVVHLTTPNRHHFEQCQRALGAGKHVICEKPLALTVDETAELVRLAAERPRQVAAVCYNVRFYPLNLEAKSRLHGLGSVFHVTGSYVQDWLLHPTDFNWRVLAAEGGTLRAVADIGTHWLDLVQFVTGLRVVAVCADLQTCHAQRQRSRTGTGTDTFADSQNLAHKSESVVIDTEDFGSVLLRFHNGARGVFHVSQVTAGRKNCLRYEIAARSGALAWNSEHPDELWLGYRDRSNELLLRDPVLLSNQARRCTDYPGGHAEGFPDSFKQFFKSVYAYIAAQDWEAPVPFPSFVDGHRAAVLCAAILRSWRTQRWIDVDAESTESANERRHEEALCPS